MLLKVWETRNCDRLGLLMFCIPSILETRKLSTLDAKEAVHAVVWYSSFSRNFATRILSLQMCKLLQLKKSSCFWICLRMHTHKKATDLIPPTSHIRIIYATIFDNVVTVWIFFKRRSSVWRKLQIGKNLLSRKNQLVFFGTYVWHVYQNK